MKSIGEPVIGPSGRPLPFSSAIETKGLLFLSGQVSMKNGAIVGNGIAEQTQITLDGIAQVLASEGLDLSDVVKATIFLVKASDFAEFNRVYAEIFGGARPARSTIVSQLVVPGALVEIEVIAARRPH